MCWQALPDQLSVMSFPMIFSIDKKKTSMAYPVWVFFLRRDLSDRVTGLPPYTLSGLAASRQVPLVLRVPTSSVYHHGYE